MFGTKFRSWMEAHIVRPRKKKDRKKGEKGFDSNCNSPSSHSGNRSPALHQVHPAEAPSKNLDTIHLQASAYTTVTTSSGTSAGTGSVHLSSPESAYSTGYSTDGTSPGASYPPEYYINIRTGTHYFQSSKGGNKKLGEETPVPPTDGGNDQKLIRLTNGMESNTRVNPKEFRDARTSTPNKISEHNVSQTIHATVQRQHQPVQQKPQAHRRTESCSVDALRISNFLPVPTSMPPPLVPSPPLQSPRQRSRIRTNPWLSANSSGSSTTGVKSRLTVGESSSSSGLKLTESSGSASDVNVNINVVRNSEFRPGSLSAGRSPINQNWRISPRMEIRSKVPISVARCSSSSSGSSLTQSVRSSDDDITLNEMMGKYDESYVYEKETDILSDSDPTDCEDYVDSLSDIDTGQDGGDENEPFENDDFDFIDNGSILELDKLDSHAGFRNTGHCTYFTFSSELSRKGTRLRESFLRRRTKDESSSHRSSVRSGSRRQSTRGRKTDDKSAEKRKKRVSQRRRQSFAEKCDDETANLNRVLVERMLLKNSGFNQGSRSVGGTPICLRRRKCDVNKNLSPVKLIQDSALVRSVIAENEVAKRRSNSVSYVNGNAVRSRLIDGAYMATFASEIALMEADKEADRKYKELILEAENILVNMKNNSSPVVMPSPRKIHNGLANKRVELIKNTELNIELALSKSRNSQPELQSGSIRDLEHTSPKRQFAQPCSPIRKFMERNSPGGIIVKENFYKQDVQVKCPSSPMMVRKTPQNSPSRSFVQANRLQITERDVSHDVKSRDLRTFVHNGVNSPRQLKDKPIASPYLNAHRDSLIQKEKLLLAKKEVRSSRTLKDEGLTSSSSDSDDRCDVRKKPPLLTFRSIDIGPTREGSSYCPQSEPVKRKVYAGSVTYGRIQKSLGEHNVAFRNSDGDTATDDTDDSKRSLKEKVAQLRQERIAAEANINAQDTQLYQHQLSQLRRQKLVQTIEGLKRSLEDQSATLKQTCLEAVLDNDVN
ncbi:uncharacterized protein LOC124302148 isoform X1 [Neodiprion virginianus]|uniref:uncharacterized protein LOC124302148 isoform X1 n=2 Tax=Neodiprion virginianus TaxID=2961670 RepID=UPI001EE72D66|nr:uncharacterized protein LOC124302148 isoform X1 [Neodiprion virginianus]XP_046613931.1 uncharacterized protein LOC124302148 isoform X1 [Neodiprion virginianus]XP_046613932.1 uncharacterized protein LOC124302148 isoform X1 [Neodiprion virginianus]XP_046613933.1 uncharacterized protein LOC124302148 isoform X1 [Neodiprion virginianus]XP_046613934.1 uncharacterized protein LOC124302148 isoform X1 [Neodiprion virginianus]